jgi:hypothetical protein
MRRSPFILALCALAGCQDYNFNPVGKCVIHPGSERIVLSGATTADILFVVDDSRSMFPLQQNLANNFNAFISRLAEQQKERIAGGLEPYEFHVAITTSSIFENQRGAFTGCTGGVCEIARNKPVDPVAENNAFPIHDAYEFACTGEGSACGDYSTVYHGLNVGCAGEAGVVTADGVSYPQGNFVALGANPKVLHFTKDLDWASWGTGSVDQRLNTLVGQFQDNVKVGACGSGQEQHFEAGRLAVKKALRQEGQQPSDVQPSDWPHAGAKMVVVWVGNENDCSNPPSTMVVPASGNVSGTNTSLVLDGLVPNVPQPGADTCTDPETTAAPGTFYPVDDYVTFFTDLGRPFGAAFIYSAHTCVTDANGVSTCQEGACATTTSGTPTTDCIATGTTANCIAQGGKRFKALSTKLRERSIETVEGSICDGSFANTLQKIADLVQPVNALKLPSLPATTDVAVLRIDNADRTVAKYCNGPGSAVPDWRFVECERGGAVAVGVTTTCITIDHSTGNCEANPGQSYVAQYLGLVPQPTNPNDLTTGGCSQPSDCQAALGGQADKWECFQPAGAVRGTCVCSE